MYQYKLIIRKFKHMQLTLTDSFSESQKISKTKILKED